MTIHELKFDYTKRGIEFDDFFMAAGYDEITGTYSPFGKASLKKMKDLESGIKYIRIHNLFTGPEGDHRGKVDAGCDPVKRDNTGKLIFDWSKVDKVYDVLIDLGYIPYIEFGFMPEVLSSAPIDAKYRWRYPPKNYEEWRIVIKEIVSHFKQRYPDKIDEFIFELWNEPDVHYYKGNAEEYNKLYDFTVAGLFDVFPEGIFKVGGPAVATVRIPYLKKFLEHCLFEMNHVTGDIGTKFDFLSFHLKGGIHLQKPKMKRIFRRLKAQLKVINHFKKDGKIAKKYYNSAYLQDDVELHITELDPLVGCARGMDDHRKFEFRNTPYYSAYMGYIACYLHNYRYKHDYNIRWVFSDFLHFSDEAAKGRIFAGCRSPTTSPFKSSELNEALKETRVIIRPVLKAFQILKKMQGTTIQQINLRKLGKSKINSFINKQDSVLRILVSNFNEKFDDNKLQEIKISIDNLPKRVKNVEILPVVIDADNNNPYMIWKGLGSPADLNEDSLKKMQKTENLLPNETFQLKIKNRQLLIDLKITPHSLNFYEVKFL